ncbi:DUF262 domain-containing protein [Oceanicola sp. S124]|uniref:DUF262 domain-containing protein n=1 Tax=Oceanicola sp. S124 TaxID=1042378 RepID=UPI0002558CDF|nr:DUF262 domain-containing protein [Oceanicola sp. S124]
MSFNDMSVAAAMKAIQTDKYVLPAIQREFVWREDRICQLFDSLMQGYPIGQLLFWTIEPQNVKTYRLYRFMRHYHARDRQLCEEFDTEDVVQPLTGVLDGQQRLTALHIGLRGSFAAKKPYGRKDNDDAYPKKNLYLDLVSPEDKAADGVLHEFRFFDSNAELPHEGWFPVCEILDMTDTSSLSEWVMDRDFDKDTMKRANKRLHRLHSVVHVEKPLSYYTVEEQDLDRVLQIFIRVNSKGMVLSYSDLLLSIASAQWTNRDAREAVNGIVEAMNAIGGGYDFSKDFVLKAGLMLLDIKSVGFRVSNFDRPTMARMDDNWEGITSALELTVKLASELGIDARALRADSALLPIAYYLYKKGVGEKYLSSSNAASDRSAIRLWLIKSLLKQSGIWGSGLDVLLTALRTVIEKQGTESFPAEALEREMAARGRSLVFSEEEIERLVELKYGDKLTRPLLVLLYPFIDTSHLMHVDHIYPKSRFTRAKLKRDGVDEDDIEHLIDWSNRLPNLQLLKGVPNQEKSAKFPATWLQSAFADKQLRQSYMKDHDLRLPDGRGGWVEPGGDPHSFETFYENRENVLRSRIKELIGQG